MQDHFFFKKDLTGKKALVTAGPTHEALDPVRFIGNHSSGKMGVAIATELSRRGATVTLVLGPSETPVPESKSLLVERVESAEQMYQSCIKHFPAMDIAVMAAAVADYAPANFSKEKIKKKEANFALELVKTKDILQSLGQKKKPGQLLVGFALENANEAEYAMNKLKSKHADLIVLNSLRDQGAGFGFDTNKITIFEKDGHSISYEQKPKRQVARDIVDRIAKMLYA